MKILYIVFSLFGSYVVYYLVHLVTLTLSPKPSEELIDLQSMVWRATESGDWQGDSDINLLEAAMKKAEIDKPGSTLRLYVANPYLRPVRAVGSMIVVFILLGWVMNILHPSLLTVVCLFVGLSFLFSAFLRWYISRVNM